MENLKRQKFRYIEKGEIEKPLHHLHEFYKQDVPFEDWRTDVELLLLSGLDGRLKRNGFEYSLTGQRLIKHIEIAYVLYVVADIKNRARFQRHPETIRGMYNILTRGYLYQPTEALLLFFECKSLEDWIQQMELIVNFASLSLTAYEHQSNDDGLFIYNRTMALVDSLHRIYKNDSLEMDMLGDTFKRRCLD